MKSLAQYHLDVAYKTMSEDTMHIIVPLEVHSLTKGFAQGFQTLLDKIHDTEKQEQALDLAVARAFGFILAVDADIDILVTKILHAAAVKYGKTSAFYLFLTNDKTEGEIREPVLEEELYQVKTWIDPLKTNADPSLAEHGLALEQKVTEAEQRVAEHAAAELLLKQFMEIGGRKQLVDEANALRASTYGALNQLVLTQPDAGLPADVADRVFRYERLRRYRRPLTSKEIDKKIKANEKEHASLIAQLTEAKAAEAAAVDAKTKKKWKPAKAALTAKKKKAATLQAEIAALEADLPPLSQ